MTPQLYEQLIEVVRRKPQPLGQLHSMAGDAGSTWSAEQLHLMFQCMAGVDVNTADGKEPVVSLGERTGHDELTQAIMDVVQAQEKPVPAAQVLNLLPGKFTTSVEQIKKIAKGTPGLKVVGPGLIVRDE